jgi:MOSC domain-containing protein YiiM/ferredoxin-NADP reductase
VSTDRGTGSLLSVNVGLPKDVAWHGRTVHTAVWKRPVDGPQMVRRLNIDGDGQGDLAGHGGEHRAVFVYQIESYRYWQQQLGRDDFGYGQFGENLTVAGLADDQVRIGDRYQIGEALFEVTQPRVTCYRVGIRMNDPQIPALLVSHHRPGFYLRVLREAAVQAGDEIVQVASGPEAITVAEVDALLYLPGHSREQVVQALRIPALPDGWKTSFRAMLDQPASPHGADGNAGLTAVSPPPAWPGFRPLTVTALDRETESVLSVHLADPDGAAVPPAQPGQFLTVRLPASPDAQPLVRSYSLSGSPGESSYRITVKLEPHGAGSQFMHTRVQAGDLLDVAAPRGTFILRPGDTPVLLISAGVGATPVLAMLHALAEAGSGRDIWWIHGARSRADEPFAMESRSLLAELAHGHRHISYSRPGADDVPGRDYPDGGAADPGRARRPQPASGRGRLPLRPSRVHGPGVRRASRPGHRQRPGAYRDLRCDGFVYARHRARPGPATAPARRPAGRRPGDRLRAQRPDGALERGLRQPPRAGRSLRRAGAVVMPHRHLPHL